MSGPVVICVQSCGEEEVLSAGFETGRMERVFLGGSDGYLITRMDLLLRMRIF